MDLEANMENAISAVGISGILNGKQMAREEQCDTDGLRGGEMTENPVKLGKPWPVCTRRG